MLGWCTLSHSQEGVWLNRGVHCILKTLENQFLILDQFLHFLQSLSDVSVRTSFLQVQVLILYKERDFSGLFGLRTISFIQSLQYSLFTRFILYKKSYKFWHHFLHLAKARFTYKNHILPYQDNHTFLKSLVTL